MSKTGLLSKTTTAIVSIIAATIAFLASIILGEFLYEPIKIIFELIGRSKKDIILPEIATYSIFGFLSLWIVLWLIKKADIKQSFRTYSILTIFGLFITISSAAIRDSSKQDPYHLLIEQSIILIIASLAMILGAYIAARQIEDKRDSYEYSHSYTPINYEYEPSDNPANEEDENEAKKEDAYDEMVRRLEELSEKQKTESKNT